MTNATNLRITLNTTSARFRILITVSKVLHDALYKLESVSTGTL